MNLKGNFKIVPEGERILTITKAEATPSGKPDKLKVTFQDIEGGTIESRYMFDNDVSIYAMSMLISKALGLGDGEEFDTKRDTEKLIGVKVKCEVVHKNLFFFIFFLHYYIFFGIIYLRLKCRYRIMAIMWPCHG